MLIRRATLTLTRTVLGRLSFPGRFVLIDAAVRFLVPEPCLVAGRIGKYTVQLDLHDDVQRHVYFGLYDRPLTRLLQHLLHPGAVFYDVGANIGYFTLLGAELVGSTGEVHAFEPVPNNLRRIEEALSSNGIGNVLINATAVSDEPGTLKLFLPELVSNSGWASFVPSARRPIELVVPTLKLDDYVFQPEGRRPPNLVKLDIEGAEPRALLGMQRLLALVDAPDLVVEANPFLLERSGASPLDLVDRLVGAGYEVFRLQERGLAPLSRTHRIDQLTDLYATKRRGPRLEW